MLNTTQPHHFSVQTVLSVLVSSFLLLILIASQAVSVARAETSPAVAQAEKTPTVAQAETSPTPTVVSINLCADQLVLMLAEPQQILSLSNLSHDKAGSYLYEQASQYPVNTASSEQILKLEPEVVIAGEYTAAFTLKLLRELDVRVEVIPIANTLDQLYANIENVATWLGHALKGEALVAELRASVVALKLQHGQTTGDNPSAAYYDPNGYTVGNQTLRGQVLQLSGWRNVASDWGITHYGSLPIESLVKLAPDAIIDSPYSIDTYSRGQQMLEHPALQSSGLNPRVISIPSRQTICAGPWTIDMIEQLAVERDNMVLAK